MNSSILTKNGVFPIKSWRTTYLFDIRFISLSMISLLSRLTPCNTNEAVTISNELSLNSDKLSALKKRLLKGKLSNISKGKIKVDYRMRFPDIKKKR